MFLFVSQRALVQIDDVLGVGRVVVLRRPEMRRLLKHITHTHTHTHTHTEKKEEEKFVKLNDFLEASPFSLATGSYPPCLPLHPMSPFWPMLAPFWRGGGDFQELKCCRIFQRDSSRDWRGHVSHDEAPSIHLITLDKDREAGKQRLGS